MKKRFLAMAFLCFAIIKGLSQSIHYSNNKLHNSEYRHKIIGEVNNNIIVWATDLSKHRTAKIFVYDKSMHLINTINTNILQYDPSTDPHFFVTGNTFQVLYPSKTENSLLLRLAAFNEKAEMLYDRILDNSINPNNTSNENTYYQVLQSPHKHIICFTKMLSDRQHHTLKFSFSFINENAITVRTFNIPFYEDQEDITDMLVDDNKNVVLLKQLKEDSAVNLTLIKLNFADNLVLGANKSVGNYFFKSNSMHIAQNAGGYTVFGLAKKENRNLSDLNKKEGLYIWQTDNDLYDITSDTILSQGTDNNLATKADQVPGNAVFSNIFAVWNAFEDAGSTQKRRWVYNSQNGAAATQSYANINSSNFTYRNLSLIYYDEKALMNETPDSVKLIKEADKYQPYKLRFFRIDNSNKIMWQTAIMDSLDNITTANLNNAKIIAGDKLLHIVCEIFIKNQPASLGHITIQPDGAITEKFITNWNKKYKYDLNASVITGNGEVIVPSYKGDKVVFANIKLE